MSPRVARGEWTRDKGKAGDERLTLEGQSRAWQSPTAAMAIQGGCYPRGNPTLVKMAEVWPTPDASLIQDREEPATWERRRAEMKAKGINGNGCGTPLSMAAKLWPTPMQKDDRAPRSKAAMDRRRADTAAGHRNLNDEAAHWPTPNAADNQTSPNYPHKGGNPTLPMAATTWPTPAERDHKGRDIPGRHGRTSLGHAVETGEMTHSSPPAPSRDAGSRSFPSARTLRRLAAASRLSPRERLLADCWTQRWWARRAARSAVRYERRSLRAKLNPLFTEWLMGWPIGWTGFAPLGTELVRWRAAMRASLLQLVCSTPGAGSETVEQETV